MGERILGRGNLRGFDEASGVLFLPVYRLLFAELWGRHAGKFRMKQGLKWKKSREQYRIKEMGCPFIGNGSIVGCK